MLANPILYKVVIACSVAIDCVVLNQKLYCNQKLLHVSFSEDINNYSYDWNEEWSWGCINQTKDIQETRNVLNFVT